jgi:short-subunit dehydrogenase
VLGQNFAGISAQLFAVLEVTDNGSGIAKRGFGRRVMMLNGKTRYANYLSAVRLTNALLPAMIQRRGGVTVNILPSKS